MTIAQQLTRCYIEKETWHKNRLSEQEANLYHERLLTQGNILTIVENEELVAYIEVWRVNFEQLGRLVCGEAVYAFDENIVDGEIAYVNNGWVKENSKVAKVLESNFLERFKTCKYIARKRQKYNESFKVYPMRIKGE